MIMSTIIIFIIVELFINIIFILLTITYAKNKKNRIFIKATVNINNKIICLSLFL